MTELPEDSESETTADPPTSLVADQAYLSRLRELELELDKIRSQASAARLDARAAELELQIQRLGDQAGAPVADTTGQRPTERASDQLSESRRSGSPRPAVTYRPQHRPAKSREGNTDSGSDGDWGAMRLSSWDDLRRLVADANKTNPSSIAATTSHQSRIDAPASDVRTKRIKSKQPARSKAAKSSQRTKLAPIPTDAAHARSDKQVAANEVIQLTTGPEKTSEKRRKPGVWLLSVVVHGMILALLAAFTLSRADPGDQVAIAGSVSDTDELAIESLQIETAEMPETASEPSPSEMEYEISDIGEIPISDLINDAVPAPPSPMLDSMIDRDAINAASMSMKSDSDAKIKFCGVEGGGNHFIYLVDSSASMGSAFDSARKALLESIGVLKPNQRFYVIFFDAESDYMRLSSPDQDEPRSAFATPQNKAALQRWAMKISMDRGRAPYDAIPFALELRPDVIFLLSDGEFPQKIEDLLRDTNRVDNLFGDEGPISIVHTIGYHSREGESRMQRIAKQNGGQYRYVPKP